jgi:methylated-DNA-[protein]-cysteine S-methyltransferase
MSENVERLVVERVPSPIGPLLVVCDAAGVLRALELHDDEAALARTLGRHCPGGQVIEHGRVAARVTGALADFFAGRVHAIDALPVHTAGTDFQRRVWSALRRIPAGTTLGYGQLAAVIGSPGASRAVGLANGSNPIAIVVPCHRVIGADKSLTGYGGGLERKRWLLDHERRWCAPLFAERERPT